MHNEEVKLLFQRSNNFLETAKFRLNKKDWDLTCFLAEQAAQLYLKATILELSGEIPKIHSLRQLIAILSQLINIQLKFERKDLLFLENAYLNSRYFDFSYEEEDAKEAIKIVEEVIKEIDTVRENFRN
ncbi:MAG: HEPN domain-containing protein [Promethearchaeota archaeon]|nr:MAG: HEPN domain-containing protein [Candidatus Lokiarchaeota archaeon]